MYVLQKKKYDKILHSGNKSINWSCRKKNRVLLKEKCALFFFVRQAPPGRGVVSVFPSSGILGCFPDAKGSHQRQTETLKSLPYQQFKDIKSPFHARGCILEKAGVELMGPVFYLNSTPGVNVVKL